jgi:hypothetical protein
MHEFQVGKETHIFLKNGDEIWGELIAMDAIGVTMKKKKGQCFDSEGDRVNTYCTSDVDFVISL